MSDSEVNNISLSLLNQFRNPDIDQRGTPFWSWNNRLDPDQLIRQIEYFRQMGMGGFFMHVRTGLDTEYLGPDFMNCVTACVKKSSEIGMRAWLYDEDRWPSGYAGGLITDDHTCRERYLLFTIKPYGSLPPELSQPREWPMARNERGQLLARYYVVLNDGILAEYHRLKEDELPPDNGVVWYAYLEIQEPCAGWNHATLGDVMNPETARRFINITHERYDANVGEYFGETVPGIFTDEPHFECKHSLIESDDLSDFHIPFTDDLPESYKDAYGDDLLDKLPEIIWELPDNAPSVTRYRFHNHLCDRLVNGFLRPINEWCSNHGLSFVGHLAEEATLESQTMMNGDIMRGYPYFHIPGIDILNDGMEYNTAKQCQSVVRQSGKNAMASELYGITGWDFSFADFKAQGDWQAALGVTQRVHHLAWVSMEGEAKHDYPGSIFYQQPWWREFAIIEDHFARINTLMKRGRPVVNIGVIHPVESFWLSFGPLDKTQGDREKREWQFKELTSWLLHELIDFDFINESLLQVKEDVAVQEDKNFHIDEMSYKTVIVPGMRTIRRVTLDRLEKFADNGGNIIFIGEIPTLVDAVPSDQLAKFANRCIKIPFEKEAVIDAVSTDRFFDVEFLDVQSNKLLHQLRQDGEDLYLFVCNTDRKNAQNGIRFRFSGNWTVMIWDTMTGDVNSCPVSFENGFTNIDRDFPPHGHLLISLSPVKKTDLEYFNSGLDCHWVNSVIKLPNCVPVTLSEPNVMPLDMARWRWNEEEWQPMEETLRIEDILRSRFGLQLRRSHIAQPWCEKDSITNYGQITMEFDINCDCYADSLSLAIEKADSWKISLDGQDIPVIPSGWWVDEAIQIIRLPCLEKRLRVLRLVTDFNRKTALEWCYLLGNFGVSVDGVDMRLTSPVRELSWGDWTSQGLPFYSGNICYTTSFEMELPCRARLRDLSFNNPLLRIAVDGNDKGVVAFAPYNCDLGELSSGQHKLELTAYGTRQNSFGPLHYPGLKNKMPATGAWHSHGDDWSYLRQIQPKGIIKSPEIEINLSGQIRSKNDE